VTLDGSGSTASGGASIVEYRWDYWDAGGFPAVAYGVAPIITIDGWTTVTLTVIDSEGMADTDEVNIEFSVLSPPIARAGADQSVAGTGALTPVTLNGTASTATYEPISLYRWYLNGTYLLASGPIVTVELPEGTHQITLKVRDSDIVVQEGTDTVVVTVGPPPLPSSAMTPVRGAVDSTITYSIAGWTPNQQVAIVWHPESGPNLQIKTVTANAQGVASGTFSVPPFPGGPAHEAWFSAGNRTVTFPFRIDPSIVPSSPSVTRGQNITIDIRGFAPNETVLVLWKLPSETMSVGFGSTNSAGSASGIAVTVPAGAPLGSNEIHVATFSGSESTTINVTAGAVVPSVSITPIRTTVNNWITYNIRNYPANSSVQITWRRLTGSTIDIDTVQTDANGAATGQFRVPATPGGAGQQIIFSSGAVTKTVLFEVAPRVKVSPTPAGRGQTIDISLRGFARKESIRIRWRKTGSSTWIVLATGTTSNTGSANIRIPVPSYAADGTWQLRAETASFNQQTNVVEILGGVRVQTAEEIVVTPEPTVAITPTVIDRSALPLETPLEVAAITDETGTLDILRDLTDGDLRTGWSGALDPIRQEARLTIDLGRPHTLSGFAWLTETGGCGQLTDLDYSLDGETWTAFDPYLEPGPIGEGMVWRYQAQSGDVRFIRFTFAPKSLDQTMVGCISDVEVWGTPIVTEVVPVDLPAETPVSTDVPTPQPTEPPVEETPVAEPTAEPTVEPVIEPTAEAESGA
jgi:hypothetical protein